MMVDDINKRDEFKRILIELAEKQVEKEEIKGYYQRFENLYWDENPSHRFRHYYYDIFNCLVYIKNDEKAHNLEHLNQNIISLFNYADSENCEKKIVPSLKKLLDHVSLETARIQYYAKMIEDSKGEEIINDITSRINRLDHSTEEVKHDIAQVKQDVDLAKQDVTKAKKAVSQAKFGITQAKNVVQQAEQNAEKASKKLKNVQKEYIAILSIFASVILAFTGGLSFLGKGVDIIENVDVKIENVTFVLGIGGVLFLNLLFGMFKFISAILDKEFGFKCLIGLNIIVVVALVLLIWLRGLYTI